MSKNWWRMLALSATLWTVCITSIAWCKWLGWNYDTTRLFAIIFGGGGALSGVAVVVWLWFAVAEDEVGR